LSLSLKGETVRRTGGISVGVDGFTTHPWPSVERTRKFYERALSSEFDLRQLDHLGDEDFASHTDAVLSFHSLRCWQLPKHPEAPLIFALHGGAILHQEFLRAHLGRLETSDVLVVNCTSDVTIMRKFFADDAPAFCHLPLPVDSSLFHPRDRVECREALDIAEFDYVVGFVGRLLPQRNLHRFLYMLAELKRRLAPRTIAALVVGNYWVDYPVLPYRTGLYPEHIRELIPRLGLKENVIYFPAGLSDEDLALCYAAMDILVHPTNALDENFGYVPVEAMACGTPVVGAAYGGVKDTVVSGETGFLMPTWVTRGGIRMDIIGGLEEATRLLVDGEARERMSKGAALRAREVYTEEACGARLREAVASAVARRRAGDSRRVSLAPPAAVPEPAGLLPTVEPSWEFYQGAVADYVSAERPSPGARSKLRLAAPLEDEGCGRYRLADPAWPAEFQLDASELAVAERCGSVVTLEELEEGGAHVRETVERFIRDGLLICSA
jgi:glycosyltransferase involved in cell wall biosynthesis